MSKQRCPKLANPRYSTTALSKFVKKRAVPFPNMEPQRRKSVKIAT
jgi:hypothetical protein